MWRNKKVTAYIQGGLGNQMFQYACAYSVAHKSNSRLIIDTSSYTILNKGKADYRPYVLNEYKLDEHKMICFNEGCKSKIEKIYSRIIKRFQLGLRFKTFEKSRVDDTSIFYPEIFELNTNIFLVGWWANYKYFIDFEDDIRRQFKLKSMNMEVQKLCEKLKNEESVSVHIRRGDYVKVGWCIDDSYYFEAIKYLEKERKDIKVYVFTNDISYAKTLFKNENYVYVDEICDANDMEYLQIMAACRNQIISNSSYSWWGAFLNDNREKIVCSPKLDGMWKDFSVPGWHQIEAKMEEYKNE